VLAIGGPAIAEDAASAETREDVKTLREEVERLRRELDEVKQKQAAATPPAGQAAATTGGSEDEEIEALRREAAKEAAGGPREPGAGGAAPAAGGGGAGGGTLGAIQQRLNQFNPRITAFGDLTGRLALGEHPLENEAGERIDNHIALREVELDLRADVDPYAKAVLILAVEKEGPKDRYDIDVEEGYVTFETLPWNLRAKAGRWRQEFGVANNTHRHDLPWFDDPYPLQRFLGEEGLDSDGVSLLWLAPGVPLQAQATLLEPSGWFPAHDAEEPAYLGRMSYFHDVTDHAWLQAGASVLYGKTTAGGSRDALLGGGDLTFKYTKDIATSLVLTGELYALRRERPDAEGGEVDRALGFFVAAQVQPGLQRWYFGARYDWDNYASEVEGNREWAISGFVSYYTTEFLRIRVGYEHREIEVGTRGGPADLDTIFAQLTFVFGSHPAEPYWVNK
jgi:hypothetical protein